MHGFYAVDGPASRRKFVFGIMLVGASLWPPQIVIRYSAEVCVPDDVTQLLTEIRDIQRDQLAEYRRLAQQTVELQQRAVARQAKIARVYFASLIFGGIFFGGAIIWFISMLRH